MSGYAIIVDFVLVPGKRSEFRRLVDRNARISSTAERGCRHFDVLESREEADRVLLYEVYEDEAAFEAHVQSRHFDEFDTLSRPWDRHTVLTMPGPPVANHLSPSRVNKNSDNLAH